MLITRRANAVERENACSHGPAGRPVVGPNADRARLETQRDAPQARGYNNVA